MIKLLLTTATLFTVSTFSQVNAQIQSMNPQPGDVFRYEYFDLTIADSGSIGNNQVWDFSEATSLDETFSKTFRALTPEEQSNYGFANIAYTEDSDPTVYLMHVSNDSLTDYGDASFVFNNPMVLYTYPITTTYNFSDDYGIAGSVGFSFDGDLKTFVQGTGTLITPFGTYKNVIKIRRKAHVDVDFFGTPDQIHVDQFTWINAENNSELLTIEKSDFVNDTEEDDMYAFFLKDGVVAGVDDLKLRGFVVFPNPANDFIQVESVFGEVVSYQIYSVPGALVATGNYTSQGIGITSLETGEYLVKVKFDNGNSALVRFSKF